MTVFVEANMTGINYGRKCRWNDIID
jgi:hypothetical protein